MSERPDTIADLTAVLLAAGSSRRFGPANKLLALLGGKPLIRHGAEVLCAAGFAEVIVVTGPDAEKVAEALAGLPVRFVHNDRHLEGMGTSVAAGIRAVAPSSVAALVSTGDMPQLSLDLIVKLVAAFAADPRAPIVYPCLPDGSQRNPVLWPRHLFAELAALGGEQGAKPVLKTHAAEAVAVPADPAIFLDVDTQEELAQLKS